MKHTPKAAGVPDTNPRSIQRKIRKWLTRKPVLAASFVLSALLHFGVFHYAVSFLCTLFDFFRRTMQQGLQGNGEPAALSLPSFFRPAPIPWWGFVLISLFSLLSAAGLVWRIWKNMYLPSEELAKGSRRWTTLEELKEQYAGIPDSRKPFDGKGGVPISRYRHTLFIDQSPVNNLIIGTTRSGKGEVYVVSMIDIYSRCRHIADRASMVINDPKGELCAASAETLKKRGYNVQIMDLIHFGGLSFNLLELVKEAYLAGDVAEAQLITKTISTIMFYDPNTRDKTWQNWSIALTNALILAHVIDCCNAAAIYDDPAIKEEYYAKINMYSVARLLTDLLNSEVLDEKWPVDSFFARRAADDIARLQYAPVAGASGKQKGNIVSTTTSELGKFTLDNIARMTAQNTLDLKAVGFDTERPTALFLVLPDYDVSNHFLVTILLAQLRYVLARNAAYAPGGKCPRQVAFILDEYGNMSRAIPDMAHNITADLGRNIYYTLIVQAYSQIYKLHGHEDGQTIIGNCGNQIYLLTIDLETARYYSGLIGNETITTQYVTGDELSLNKTFAENTDQKPLLDPNQLMELGEGESVVVRVTKRRDLQGNRIKATPIFNTGKTQMKYRFEYLGKDFDTNRSLSDIDLTAAHAGISLRDIVYHPEDIGDTREDIEDSMVEDALLPPDFDLCIAELPPDTIDRLLAAYRRVAISETMTDAEMENMTMSDFDAHLQALCDDGRMTADDYRAIQHILQGGVNRLVKETIAAGQEV